MSIWKKAKALLFVAAGVQAGSERSQNLSKERERPGCAVLVCNPRQLGRIALTRFLARIIILLAGLSGALEASAAETVTYYYSDHQGTVLATANASGAVTSTVDYRPYGTQTLGSPQDGPGYTGHVNDVDTSLVYMQARYFDSTVGRFLSSDPMAPVAGNTFSVNRYAYVNNNPASNIDPDGRQCAQCLYYPDNGGQDAQVQRNYSTDALAVTAGLVVLAPAAGYVAGTATAVVADSMALGSISSGILVNAPEVVASTAIVADVGAGAAGAPGPIADEALVARGGDVANHTAEKIDAAIGESATPGIYGFSCQCDGGTNLAALGAHIPNKKMGVTTAGQIRAAGGEVVKTPGRGSHITVSGLSGQDASRLLQKNVVSNPNPKQR